VAGGAAQQRAHPRQHFLEMKRLGDIIVGAGIEALHLVAPAVARGEDQHRHRAPVARQASSTEMPSILGRPMSSTTAS
jgi:hypothetical protein